MPILFFPFVPMQDYPDWLYQGFVLKAKALGEGWAGAFKIHPYIAPNIAVTLLAGLFSFAFPLAICSRLVLGLTFAAQYAGWNRYFRLHVPAHCMGAAFLAGALCFNYSWWHGNINFVLGIGIAAWLGACAVQGKWAERGLWKVILTSFVLYACHMFGVVTFGAIVLVDAVTTRRFKCALRLVTGFVPVLLLFIHYIMNAPPSGAGPYDGMTWRETLGDRLMIMGRYLVPFPAFTGMDSSPFRLLWAANIVAGGATLVAVTLSASAIARNAGGNLRQPLVLAAIMIVGAMFAPMWGSGVVAFNERFLLFLVLNCVVCVLAGMVRFPRLLTALCLLAWLGVVGHAVYFTASFNNALPGSSTTNLQRRSHLQLHDPFVRMPYYRAIQDKQVLDVFSTGLFTSPGVGLPPGIQGTFEKKERFPPLHHYFTRLLSVPSD